VERHLAQILTIRLRRSYAIRRAFRQACRERRALNSGRPSSSRQGLAVKDDALDDANRVTITSVEWLSWLRLGPKGEGSIFGPPRMPVLVLQRRAARIVANEFSAKPGRSGKGAASEIRAEHVA
jgi:hypothetical protein